jgi:D-threo-aldose 1-dehydrogenase
VAVTLATAPLGRRGVHVTRVALGGGPLGNLFTAIDDDTATAVVDAAWDAGVRCFDTAPLYGHGLSEQRLGRALQRYPRDEFVLSTKVGRVLDPDAGFDPGIFAVPRDLAPVFDYSRDGILRSVDDSLTRLGLDRIDVALVHDPDDHEADALAGAFPTLLDLRDQGVVRAVGSGMNQAEMLARFTARVDLDCVLLAGRYTLLDRTGAGFLDECADRGVGVLLGGVFNSGILATEARSPTFDYLPAPDDVRGRAERLRELCAGYGVSLPHAAVDFALRHRGVTALVLGAGTPDEVVADAAWAQAPVPAELRAELDAFA